MPAQKEDLRREENTTERGLRQVSDEVLQVYRGQEIDKEQQAFGRQTLRIDRQPIML